MITTYDVLGHICKSRHKFNAHPNMSWLPEKQVPYTWWQSLLIRILRCGELPHHIAFIMDGNRRFAKEKNLDKIEGHVHGFEKLAETLKWCNDLGIDQVTVYAFR